MSEIMFVNGLPYKKDGISPALVYAVYRYLPTITSISLGFTSQLSSRPNLMSASSGLAVIIPLALTLNISRSYRLGFLTSTMALQVTTTDGRLLSTLIPPYPARTWSAVRAMSHHMSTLSLRSKMTGMHVVVADARSIRCFTVDGSKISPLFISFLVIKPKAACSIFEKFSSEKLYTLNAAYLAPADKAFSISRSINSATPSPSTGPPYPLSCVGHRCMDN